MGAYVALLRGVNVGKGNRVPMAEWRTLLEGLGYADVVTLLNSGNAVFTAPRAVPATLAARIHDTLAAALAVDVAVVVKSATEFDAIVGENPFTEPSVDPSRMLVAFVQEARSLAPLGAIGERLVPPERFHRGTRAAYLHCVNGIHESRAAKALLGQLGREATTRNWATTLKLQELLRTRT